MVNSKFAECGIESSEKHTKLKRIGRLSAGLTIILAGIYFKSWFGLLGLIPVIVAVTGFCPLSKLGRSC
jgi:hypothetical protein